MYGDNAIDEPSLVRKNQDNDFENNDLTNIISITLNTQAVIDNQVITKAYVYQFPNDNERNRRALGLDFHAESTILVKNNQDKEFKYIELTNIYSTIVNREPISDNEVSSKKYFDDSIEDGNILRSNQT